MTVTCGSFPLPSPLKQSSVLVPGGLLKSWLNTKNQMKYSTGSFCWLACSDPLFHLLSLDCCSPIFGPSAHPLLPWSYALSVPVPSVYLCMEYSPTPSPSCICFSVLELSLKVVSSETFFLPFPSIALCEFLSYDISQHVITSYITLHLWVRGLVDCHLPAGDMVPVIYEQLYCELTTGLVYLTTNLERWLSL